MNDVERFMASSEFRQLPRGAQAAIEQQKQAAVQAASGLRRKPQAMEAARAALFVMVACAQEEAHERA